jgi:hypothetical protein
LKSRLIQGGGDSLSPVAFSLFSFEAGTGPNSRVLNQPWT